MRTSTVRPNLIHSVRFLPQDKHEDGLVAFIRDRYKTYQKAERAIIFCRTKTEADRLAHRIGSKAYHSGHRETNEDTLSLWRIGVSSILVATSIIGSGFDYPSVRDVVHCNPSHTPLDQYQEECRAGRDGVPSYVTTFVSSSFDPSNVKTLDPLFHKANIDMFGTLKTRHCRRLYPGLYLDGVSNTCTTITKAQYCDNCQDTAKSALPHHAVYLPVPFAPSEQDANPSPSAPQKPDSRALPPSNPSLPHQPAASEPPPNQQSAVMGIPIPPPSSMYVFAHVPIGGQGQTSTQIIHDLVHLPAQNERRAGQAPRNPTSDRAPPNPTSSTRSANSGSNNHSDNRGTSSSAGPSKVPPHPILGRKPGQPSGGFASRVATANANLAQSDYNKMVKRVCQALENLNGQCPLCWVFREPNYNHELDLCPLRYCGDFDEKYQNWKNPGIQLGRGWCFGCLLPGKSKVCSVPFIYTICES